MEKNRVSYLDRQAVIFLLLTTVIISIIGSYKTFSSEAPHVTDLVYIMLTLVAFLLLFLPINKVLFGEFFLSFDTAKRKYQTVQVIGNSGYVKDNEGISPYEGFELRMGGLSYIGCAVFYFIFKEDIDFWSAWPQRLMSIYCLIFLAPCCVITCIPAIIKIMKSLMIISISLAVIYYVVFGLILDDLPPRLEPYQYLRTLFTQLPSSETLDDFEEFPQV